MTKPRLPDLWESGCPSQPFTLLGGAEEVVVVRITSPSGRDSALPALSLARIKTSSTHTHKLKPFRSHRYVHLYLNMGAFYYSVRRNLVFRIRQAWFENQALPLTCIFFSFNLGQIFLISLNFSFLICFKKNQYLLNIFFLSFLFPRIKGDIPVQFVARCLIHGEKPNINLLTSHIISLFNKLFFFSC